jgi:hypothetical protein
MSYLSGIGRKRLPYNRRGKRHSRKKRHANLRERKDGPDTNPCVAASWLCCGAMTALVISMLN